MFHKLKFTQYLAILEVRKSKGKGEGINLI